MIANSNISFKQSEGRSTNQFQFSNSSTIDGTSQANTQKVSVHDTAPKSLFSSLHQAVLQKKPIYEKGAKTTTTHNKNSSCNPQTDSLFKLGHRKTNLS